ncbi:MAG TPA: hypothetical protein VGW57_12430 [Chthoniobacterales bacterium]|nr:hypothetical protein [Chthoniobacterales bacterium]
MAYRQYTSCVNPGNFHDLGFTYLGWFGAVSAIVTFFTVSVVSGWAAAILPALIAMFVVLVSFLIWWLYGRLICLGGQKCLIGVVLGRGHPQPLTKAGDDDATMNVVLAPSPIDFSLPSKPVDQRFLADETVYWNNPNQGHLVKPNDAILALGESYVGDEGHARYVKALHCEFEGSGIRNLLAWASVVLALLIALQVILLIPGLGWLVPILLWLISVLSVFAGTTALLDPLNPGDPTDIDTSLGTLAARDIVVVKGDWIYDSLHHGWNEIHAVHACQKICARMEDGKTWPADIGGGFGLDTDEKVKAAVEKWCDAIEDAEHCEDGGSRDDPAQNWIVHPLVDGCHNIVIT